MLKRSLEVTLRVAYNLLHNAQDLPIQARGKEEQMAKKQFLVSGYLKKIQWPMEKGPEMSLTSNFLLSYFSLESFLIFLVSSITQAMTKHIYGSKLSGWEICSFCVTFCQFSTWPRVKMSYLRDKQKTPSGQVYYWRVVGLPCFYCNLIQFIDLWKGTQTILNGSLRFTKHDF